MSSPVTLIVLEGRLVTHLCQLITLIHPHILLCDGSFINNTVNVGVGYILLDNQGNIIF